MSTLCIERHQWEREREGGVRERGKEGSERGGRREGDKERGREGGSLHHVFVHNIKLSFVLGRETHTINFHTHTHTNSKPASEIKSTT